jgi:hypothetical protein
MLSQDNEAALLSAVGHHAAASMDGHLPHAADRLALMRA